MERIAFLADLHASDAGSTDGVNVTAQDGSAVRVFSNWSARLTEFMTVANIYNVDHIILLGDIINSAETDQPTVLALVCNQIEADLATNIPIHILPGNHDCVPGGTLMDLGGSGVGFWNIWDAEIVAQKRPQITEATRWPGATPGKHFSSHISESTNFTIIQLWGTAGASWDTGDPTNQTYITGEGTIVKPAGDFKNQLDWLADTALAGVAKPVIVICHESLSHRDGAATIDADILTTLQTTLAGVVNGGQNVDVFSGHYHKVAAGDGNLWRKDEVRLLPFDTGDGSEVVVGDVITGVTSGATATVYNVNLTAGAWTTDASGNLHVANQVGTFQAERISVSAGERCSATANSADQVNYYGFRGSVLARSATDLRGNTFFIIDVDTVLGVTSVRTFKYSNTSRDRYNPLDLDHIMGTHNRSRSRYQ